MTATVPDPAHPASAETTPPPAQPDSAWLRMAQRLVSTTQQILEGLADLAMPPGCLACQQPLAAHDTLCPECWTGIDFIGPPLCDRLGLPMPYDTGGVMISAAAAAANPAYRKARAVARYEGVMRTLIHDFKFRDRNDGRRLFGRWLATAGAQLIADADIIVPVPLHPVRLLSRRYNQSAILAREVARLTGLPSDPLALRRVKRTTSQVGLSTAQRQKNVQGAFTIPKSSISAIDGKRILLMDDVITTGATVNACARTLAKAGASHVDVLALALVTDRATVTT